MNLGYWIKSSSDAATVCLDTCVPGKLPIIISLIGIGIWYLSVRYMITGKLIPPEWVI